MRRKERRSSGGQPGNQNARKHGFYSHVLTPDQKKYLPAIRAMKGLDPYIEVAEVKILSVLAHSPGDSKLIFRALGTLNRLVRERNSANAQAASQANRAALALLRAIARSPKTSHAHD